MDYEGVDGTRRIGDEEANLEDRAKREQRFFLKGCPQEV
jgi:hypothetical protein